MKKLPKIVDLRGFLSFQILHELKKKHLYGDQLAHIIGKKKGSKLTPGTIYPALKRLREHKLLKVRQAGREKLYTLTKKGINEYKLTKSILKKVFKKIL